MTTPSIRFPRPMDEILEDLVDSAALVADARSRGVPPMEYPYTQAEIDAIQRDGWRNMFHTVDEQMKLRATAGMSSTAMCVVCNDAGCSHCPNSEVERASRERQHPRIRLV